MPLRAPPPHAFLKTEHFRQPYGPSAMFLFSISPYALPEPAPCLRRLSLTVRGMSFTFVMGRVRGRIKGRVTQKPREPGRPDDLMGVTILVCACGQRVRAPGATPGRIGRCPGCGGPLEVPTEHAPPGPDSIPADQNFANVGSRRYTDAERASNAGEIGRAHV